MNKNMLVDRLPDALEVSGSLVPIETNFRVYILLELLLNDASIPPEDAVFYALRLVYGNDFEPADIEAAVNAMLWFYRGGKAERKRGKKTGKVRQGRIYDFEQDDMYIYAAFVSQYGIDLNDVEYMHWWKFRALFYALTDENEIVKIMGYRSMDIGKIKDRERRMQIGNLKERYKLDNALSEEEKAASMSAAFGFSAAERK